ncbi:MAG: glycoside hydrolase [Thermomicrobiales bacterium]|nr:glycoside hydrolase [Thermomicrobiales bacterium]
MARIKMAYIGGGSTRAPGTMASFIDQGENFVGSEVVLIDLDPDRLALVKTLADKMARCKGLDLTVTTTTDRRAGLADCDAVLSSFRPGGFQARVLDESIPRKYGVIGQETQGPGGFFMALRSLHVMQGIVEDLRAVAPKAIVFNYTNPVNIVAQAVTQYTDTPIVSLCEGPLIYPAEVVEAAGLDPDKADVASIGLNHASWSVRQTYDGEDLIPLLTAAWQQREDDPTLRPGIRRMWELAVLYGSLPTEYMQYYFFEREMLEYLRNKPTTRAQDILANAPDYWNHYREQAATDCPTLDPARSRGGIHELELAIDCMDAIFNDRQETMPVNVPNRGAIPGLPDDLVVETVGYVDAAGIAPLALGPLPRPVTGLIEALGEYQWLAAKAAWRGGRREAIQALVANPLCSDLHLAETIYDEMAAALRDYLPERLLH